MTSTAPQAPRLSAPLTAMGAVLRCAIRLLGRVTVEGLEQLPQRPFILASNHISYLDSLFLLAFVAGHLRQPIAPAATRGLFVFPLTPFLRALGGVPIDRRGGDNANSLRKLAETLGVQPILIFPEGGRRKPGIAPRAYPGVGLLALTAGVPVVPVRVTGTDEVLRAFRRPDLRLVIGRPVVFGQGDYPDVPVTAARAAIARQVLDTIEALS